MHKIIIRDTERGIEYRWQGGTTVNVYADDGQWREVDVWSMSHDFPGQAERLLSDSELWTDETLQDAQLTLGRVVDRLLRHLAARGEITHRARQRVSG